MSYRAEQQHIRHTGEQEAEAEVYTGDRRQTHTGSKAQEEGSTQRWGARRSHGGLDGDDAGPVKRVPARGCRGPPGWFQQPIGVRTAI